MVLLARTRENLCWLQSLTYTLKEGITYNSKFWVSVTNGIMTSKRYEFSTHGCQNPYDAFLRCSPSVYSKYFMLDAFLRCSPSVDSKYFMLDAFLRCSPSVDSKYFMLDAFLRCSPSVDSKYLMLDAFLRCSPSVDSKYLMLWFTFNGGVHKLDDSNF